MACCACNKKYGGDCGGNGNGSRLAFQRWNSAEGVGEKANLPGWAQDKCRGKFLRKRSQRKLNTAETILEYVSKIAGGAHESPEIDLCDWCISITGCWGHSNAWRA